ncbi:hypothetical protein TWF694_010079 [Orbilia ellipsospora]|uniref:Uncharacterized protein n=1 Tax=Orbilia ellipsospora TaxID=2528407 RepID=A0AAV9XA09_9PEZI
MFCICSRLLKIYLEAISTALEHGTNSQQVFIFEMGDALHIFTNKSKSQNYAGVLKQPFASVFKHIVDEYSVDFDCYCPERLVVGNREGLWIAIDLFSSSERTFGVARDLARNQLYLDKPHRNRRKLPYQNPHNPNDPGQVASQLAKEGLHLPGLDISVDRDTPKVGRLSKTELCNRHDEVSDIFTTTSHARDIPRNIDLPISERIITHLESHQRDGVLWMLSKEDFFSPNKQQRSRGGIFADEIGLGRVLTTLALIATSGDLDTTGLSSAATLLLCPKSAVNGWIDQILQHTRNLKFLIYDPTEWKTSDPNFHDYELVITTYTVVANKNLKPARLLTEKYWKRVILDEAHVIHDRTSRRVKAVFALNSNHRWCLTGTVVVNKLEDYGSLLQFIQYSNLDTKEKFQDSIIKPLRSKDEQALNSFRDLVKDTTLRRLKQQSQSVLPPLEIRVERLEFSPNEQKLHDLVQNFITHKIQQGVQSGETKHGATVHHNQLILRLRQICNHGVDLFPNSLQERLRDLDVKGGSEFAISNALVDLICEQCTKVQKVDTQGLNTFDECQHIICSRCNTGDGECPICSTANREVIPTSIPPSTKVQALLHNLQLHAHPLVKSVVLSRWTKMLDLIEIAFLNHGILYTRIDSSLNLQERLTRLDAFRRDPSCSILLTTLGSGSLNVTVASHIHLLEPQWDSTSEEDALACVHRIGQTQLVTVFRYMMASSYEEQIPQHRNGRLQIAELCSSGNTKSDGNMAKYLECLESLNSSQMR